jgi:hypothetical protein
VMVGNSGLTLECGLLCPFQKVVFDDIDGALARRGPRDLSRRTPEMARHRDAVQVEQTYHIVLHRDDPYNAGQRTSAHGREKERTAVDGCLGGCRAAPASR